MDNMVYVSAVTCIVSIIALVVSIVSIYINYNSAKNEWRPYLSFDHIVMESSCEDKQYYTFRIIIKNTGRTIVRCKLEHMEVSVDDQKLVRKEEQNYNDEMMVPVDANLITSCCFTHTFYSNKFSDNHSHELKSPIIDFKIVYWSTEDAESQKYISYRVLFINNDESYYLQSSGN